MAETRVVITGDANQAVSEFQRLLAAATGSLQNIAALGGSTAKVMAGIAGTVAAAGAAYLSFGGIISGVNDSIDRLAQLDDSAQKTGSSIVDSLSKLQKVAMMTDVEFGNVDKAVFNLAKSLGSAGEESGKVKHALADLGISAKDIANEDPAATFIRISKSLQNYEDGAGKSAVMNTLFKKSAEELMPFMNDVAESVDKFSGRTSQAAAQASGFQDSMGLMKVRTAEMYDVLTESLLPAISAFTGRLLDSDGVISQLSGRIDALGKSGELSAWAEDIATGVGYVVNAVVPAVKVATAYFALFVAAPVIYTAVASAVSTLVGVIATYAVNVLIGQTATIGLNTTLFGTSVAAQLAAGSLTKMALASNVLFAAFAGWQIGAYLRDNFVEARLAGLTFVGVMLKGWENLKYNLSVAFEAIGFSWDKTVGSMKIAHAGFVSTVAKGFALIGQDDRAAQMEAYATSLRAAGGAVGTFADRTVALDAAHKAEIDTIDKNIVEMMAYELASKGVAQADGTVEDGKKKVLKATKDNADAIKAELEAYAGLISGIKAKIAEGRLELALDENATESQKARIRLDQELASGKLKLSAAHQATVRGLLDEQAAVELLLKARATEKEVAKYIEQSTIARAASTAQLAVEYQAYGQSSDARDIAMVAVKEQTALEQFLNQQKLAGRAVSDEQIVQLKGEAMARAAVEQATLAQSKALGYAAQLADDNARFAAESIADPRARADALLAIDAHVWQQRIVMAGAGTEAQRLLQDNYNTWYKNQSQKILVDVDLTRANELLNIVKAVDDAARDAATGMSESFGRVGSAIGGLTTALTGYAVQQQAVAAQLAAVKADPKSGPETIARAEIAATKASAQAQIKSYGDMAGAAKGFFKENTKGYKLLESTEKAYRAYEMAIAVETMLTKSGLLASFTGLFVAAKATETAATVASVAPDVAASVAKGTAAAAAGVAGQAAGDPYTAFARMALMAAAMAALGFAVGGGGGGGMSVSQQRQAANGTGSVLGDSSAKSESIAKSLEIIAKDSGLGLAHSASMVVSLKQIASGIGNLGSLLARNDDIAKAGAAVAGSSSGGFFGGIVNSIFGGKTSVQDTGVVVGKASLGTVAQSGLSADAYTDTKKSGGWFSSDKYKTELRALGSEIDSQFSMIITGMGATITQQAQLLGLASGDFADRLNTFVVDLGKISFKDLTGAEQQAALETAFSKVGDDMARFGVAGLEKYQKVGEGYLETLARVSNDYVQVSDVMAVLGKQFNVTGLDAVALSQGLISAAGDLDTLTSGTAYFVDNFLTEAQKMAPITASVKTEMARLGLSGVTTMDQFSAVILGQADATGQLKGGLDLSTAANQELYASMVAIAPAFQAAAEYAAELAEATTGIKVKSAADIASERAELQNELDELTMTTAQWAKKAADAIAPANRALYDQVIAERAVKDAIAEAGTILDLQAQMYAANGDKAGQAAVLLAQHQAALVGLTPAVAAATQATWAAQAAEQVRAAALSESNSLLAIQAQIYDLTGDKAGAAAVLQQQHAAALASLSPALAEATKALWNAQTVAAATKDVASAQATLQSAYANQRSALQEIIDLREKEADATKKQIDALKMSDLSTLSPEQKYLEAQRQFDMAAAGEEKSAAAQALLTVSRNYNGSTVAYARDYAKVQAALALQAASQASGATIAQQQMDALNQQVGKLIDINYGVSKLDSTMTEVQKAILGLGSSMLTLANVNTAVGKPNVGNGAQLGQDAVDSVLAGLYQQLLGRAPDAAGLKFWEAAAASGQSYEQIIKGIKASPEYAKLNGSHANGLEYVPFDGYRAELHRGERVQTAAQVTSDKAANAAMVKLLGQVLIELRADKTQRGAVGKDTLAKLSSLELRMAKQSRVLERAE